MIFFDIVQKVKILNKLYNNGCNMPMQYLIIISYQSFVPHYHTLKLSDIFALKYHHIIMIRIVIYMMNISLIFLCQPWYLYFSTDFMYFYYSESRTFQQYFCTI